MSQDENNSGLGLKTRSLVIPFVSLALFAVAGLTTTSRIWKVRYTRRARSLADLPIPINYQRAVPEATVQTLRQHSFVVQGEMVKRRAVIVTAATYQYLDFIVNLRCSVRAATGQEIVLFALDRNVSAMAQELGIPSIDAFYKHEDVRSEKPFKFGSNGFNVVSKLKLLAFRDALLAGIDVLFTDVDIVWCDNAPKRLVAQLEAGNSADVLIQNGRPSDSFWPVDANTGFFYATADMNVVDMFHYLAKLAEDPSSRGDFDQSLFKKRICGTEGTGIALRDNDIGRDVHLCRWEGRVIVEMLPLKFYPNGHSPLNTAFKSLKPGQLRKACISKEIVIFHNNWCSGRVKNQRMNQQKLWQVNKATDECRNLSERR